MSDEGEAVIVAILLVTSSGWKWFRIFFTVWIVTIGAGAGYAGGHLISTNNILLWIQYNFSTVTSICQVSLWSLGPLLVDWNIRESFVLCSWKWIKTQFHLHNVTFVCHLCHCNLCLMHLKNNFHLPCPQQYLESKQTNWIKIMMISLLWNWIIVK